MPGKEIHKIQDEEQARVERNHGTYVRWDPKTNELYRLYHSGGERYREVWPSGGDGVKYPKIPLNVEMGIYPGPPPHTDDYEALVQSRRDLSGMSGAPSRDTGMPDLSGDLFDGSGNSITGGAPTLTGS